MTVDEEDVVEVLKDSVLEVDTCEGAVTRGGSEAWSWKLLGIGADPLSLRHSARKSGSRVHTGSVRLTAVEYRSMI